MIRTILTGLLASAAVAAGAERAADSLGVSFSLRPTNAVDRVQLTLAYGDGERSRGTTSGPVAWTELTGFDPSLLGADASRPAGFRIVREAGTVDCSGTAGRGVASGACRFAADERFAQALEDRGVGRPDANQQFQLAVQDARLAFLDEIKAAGYPTPTLNQFVAAAIHDVDTAYVRELASVGYRFDKIDDLIAFRIHDVDAAYVRGLAEARPELRNLPAQKVLALRIHDVTPEFVRATAAAGYDGLDADTLTAMAIHDVSPEFVRDMAALGYRDLQPQRLIAMRIHDVTPEYVRAMREAGYADLSADQLVSLRIHDVTPDFARRMAAAGVSADGAVGARIHGRRR